jgi:hypothetical protein
MATITKRLAGHNQESVLLELDYDDVTMLATALRCINTTAHNASCSAFRVSDGANIDHTFAPGTVSFTLPTGIAARITLSILPSGKLDGIYVAFKGRA